MVQQKNLVNVNVHLMVDGRFTANTVQVSETYVRTAQFFIDDDGMIPFTTGLNFDNGVAFPAENVYRVNFECPIELFVQCKNVDYVSAKSSTEIEITHYKDGRKFITPIEDLLYDRRTCNKWYEIASLGPNPGFVDLQFINPKYMVKATGSRIEWDVNMDVFDIDLLTKFDGESYKEFDDYLFANGIRTGDAVQLLLSGYYEVDDRVKESKYYQEITEEDHDDSKMDEMEANTEKTLLDVGFTGKPVEINQSELDEANMTSNDIVLDESNVVAVLNGLKSLSKKELEDLLHGTNGEGLVAGIFLAFLTEEGFTDDELGNESISRFYEWLHKVK